MVYDVNSVLDVIYHVSCIMYLTMYGDCAHASTVSKVFTVQINELFGTNHNNLDQFITNT